MLLAPFPSPAPSRRVSLASSRRAAPRTVLVLWLAGGIAALACIPAARGGTGLGATLPFWLVAAPAIDLAWIERRRIARRIADIGRALARGCAGRRNVRRQRVARSRACKAARS